MKILDTLQDFLLEHYKEAELRRLARSCSVNGEISASLPGRPVAYDELVLAAVDAFQRHGAIDEHFWRRLHEARPKLTAKIAAIQALFLSPPAQTAPLQLILTRVNASERRRFIEIEFVLRNDGPSVQTIKEIHVLAEGLQVDYTPDVRFSGVLDQGKFTFAVINNGWGSVSFTGEVSVREGQDVKTGRVAAAEIPSGDNAVRWQERVRGWKVEMSVRGDLENLVTHERVAVSEDRTVFDSCLFGGPHCGPDTTYVCILDATMPAQQKVYRTIRTIASGETDVFQCVVSATKAARFDLTVNILATDDSCLSTCQPGLTIWRHAQKQYEFGDLVDGAIFVLDRDNVWRLSNPAAAPWRQPK